MQTNYVIILQLCEPCQSMLQCWWYSKQNSIVTSSGIKAELQTYASLYTTLVWIFVFSPSALFIKRFSTYLSRICWNTETRKSCKAYLTFFFFFAKHNPQTKETPYLRRRSAESDISITSYYKLSCFTTVSHLWRIKRKHSEKSG